jgi:hypothetical protein
MTQPLSIYVLVEALGWEILRDRPQLTATGWVFVGIARMHHVGFPLDDLRIAAAGALSVVTSWGLAGEAHDLTRLGVAAAGGLLAFLLAALALRLIGPREWNLLTTSTRRLLTSRAGVTTP